jgi:hypothetical protein
MEWLAMTLDDLLGTIGRAVPGPGTPPASQQAYVTAAMDRVRVMVALLLPMERRRAADEALVAARRRLVAEVEAGCRPTGTELQAAIVASLRPSLGSSR